MMTKERMNYALELIKNQMDKGGKMDDELLDLICDEVLPSLYSQGTYDLNQTNSPVKLNITPSDNSQNIQTSLNKNTASNNTIQQTYNNQQALYNRMHGMTNIVTGMCMSIDDMQHRMDTMFNLINGIYEQMNSIQTNTEEIKQMIIPATIINK